MESKQDPYSENYDKIYQNLVNILDSNENKVEMVILCKELLAFTLSNYFPAELHNQIISEFGNQTKEDIKARHERSLTESVAH